VRLSRGQPATLLGTTISTNVTQLSENAIFVAFRLQNSNASDQTVDVGVSSDVYFDRNDAAPIDALSNNRGFVMYSTANAFTLIGRDYSLVRSLTTYWFGALGSRSANLWTQTSATTFSGSDSAMSFSWQGILIPSGQSTTVSMIMRSGTFDSVAPTLMMTDTIFPAHALPTDLLRIRGRVSDAHSDASVRLLFVIDDDYSRVHWISPWFRAGSSFDMDISLSLYSMKVGSQMFGFYAVNNVGCVSSGHLARVTIIPNPTATPLPSHSATAHSIPWPSYSLTVCSTPLPSHSPIVSLTPLPTHSATSPPTRPPSPTPFDVFPLSVVDASNAGAFEIIARDGWSDVYTTGNRGYSARMQIDGTLARIVTGQSTSWSSVVASTHFVSISQNVILIVFKFVNSDLIPKTVDVEVDADVTINGNDATSVLDLGGGLGFIMYSSPNGFTFIGQSYPLVTNLSTYWFGYSGDRSTHYWTQVTQSSYSGSDVAISFSWQNILIPSRESVCLSMIVRSGSFDSSRPVLTIIETGNERELFPTDDFLIRGIVSYSRAFGSMSLFFVINDDYSQLSRITSSLIADSPFALNFSLVPYSVRVGSQNFGFYAVSDSGCVSSGQFVSVTIIPHHTSIVSAPPAESDSGVDALLLVGIPVAVAMILLAVVGIVFMTCRHKNGRAQPDEPRGPERHTVINVNLRSDLTRYTPDLHEPPRAFDLAPPASFAD
jgi:hypothetical protein